MHGSVVLVEFALSSFGPLSFLSYATPEKVVECVYQIWLINPIEPKSITVLYTHYHPLTVRNSWTPPVLQLNVVVLSIVGD